MRQGNLLVRALDDVVDTSKLIQDSEYLQSLLVVIPKTSLKDWFAQYETLTKMVVPRHASHRRAAPGRRGVRRAGRSDAGVCAHRAGRRTSWRRTRSIT